MTTSYPTSIDTFVNPISTDLLSSASVPHATQHANLNDAVKAIETKIGTSGAEFPSGLTILGSTSGFAGGELRLGPTTSGFASAVSTQATGSPIMYFDHRGVGATGSWIWRTGTGGATQLMTLSSGGAIAAVGGTSTFGNSVFGAAGTHVAIGQYDGSTVQFAAAGSATDVSINIIPKGAGVTTVTSNDVALNSGTLRMATGTGRTAATASAGGGAAIPGTVAFFWQVKFDGTTYKIPVLAN